MKTCIAYFSRQGNTKRAAEILAERMKADLIELTEKVKYTGIIGFLRGGFRATQGAAAKLDEMTLKRISTYDRIVVATPVWAGKTTPACNAVLAKADLKGKTVVVLTMQGDPDFQGHDNRVAAIKERLAEAGAVFGGCYPAYGGGPFQDAFSKAELEKQLKTYTID